MSEAHHKRVAKEKKRAFLNAWVINGSLIFYFLFAVAYLVDYFRDGSESTLLESRLFYFYALISVAVGYFWARANNSVGRFLIHRTNPLLKSSYKAPPLNQWMRSFSGIFSTTLLVLTFVLGWLLTEMSVRSLLSIQGLEGAKRIFVALVRPELGIVSMVMEAMIVTIFIALMATVLAIPISFLLSFFMARNLMKFNMRARFVYNTLRFFSNFTRSVEPLIWAIIFSVWVGIGPFAGMLALAIHSVAALTKLYSEQIENIDRGPLEAIEATGASRVQVVWYAVVPQILLPYLSFTIYRWDINIRMATIIGLVGGGGIGTLLVQYQGLAKWHEVGTIVIVIAIVVWIMDYLSARIREAIY